MDLSDWISLLSLFLSLLLAGVGWAVVYRQTITAQREQLKLELLNEARKQTCASLRDYQRWCGAMAVGMASAESKWALAQGPLKVAAPFQLLLSDLPYLAFEDSRALAWLERLEEYELILPFTVDVRADLLSRDRNLQALVAPLIHELRVNPAQAVGSFTDAIQTHYDMMGLAQDLLVHIQNRTLGSLTDRSLHQRSGLGIKGPRIVADAKGNLSIVEIRAGQ